MEQKNINKIIALTQRWGTQMQFVLTVEEAAELCVACCKILRGGAPRPVVVDALADMYVMLQTMSIVAQVSPEELEAAATHKLDIAMAKSFPPESGAAGKLAQPVPVAEKPSEEGIVPVSVTPAEEESEQEVNKSVE